MKTIKELGIAHKDLKAVCKSFNDANLVKEKIKLVGLAGEAMLVLLVKLIDTVPDGDMHKIPGDVSAFYDAIPEEVFNTNVSKDVLKAVANDDLPAADKVKVEEEDIVEETDGIPGHTTDCPIYGTGWNPKETICVECNKTFHPDYVSCKRIVKGITSAKSKKKPEHKKQTSTTPRKASNTTTTRYGHRPNTMAGQIDDLVWAGTTMDNLVASLMQWHGRDVASAKGKAKGHVLHLINRGITITTDTTSGIIKAVQEFIPTKTAENTVAAEPSVEQ